MSTSFTRGVSVGAARCSRQSMPQRIAAVRFASTDATNPLEPRNLPGMGENATKALPTRVKPMSRSHYTGKPVYVETLFYFTDLINRLQKTFRLNSIPYKSELLAEEKMKAQSQFKVLKITEMTRLMTMSNLTTKQYQTITTNINALTQYLPLVKRHLTNGDCGQQAKELAQELQDTLQTYIRDADVKEVSSVQYPVFLSANARVLKDGRTYAYGGRKEASAQVWIVPKTDMSETSPLTSFGASILVNNKQIHEYFTDHHRREELIMPLRASGLLGAYNVFALVRGGGPKGQAGAVQNAIARALVCLFDDKARTVENDKGLSSPEAIPLREQAFVVRDVLVKQGFAKRDPRMVERKKTNMLKARKARTWVKR